MATRNVFFYEVRPTRRVDVGWHPNVSGLVAALTALPDEQRIREVEGSSGDSYEFVQVINNGTDPCIAYVRCREHGLPMLARQATLEPLRIAADRQLAELTHAVFLGGASSAQSITTMGRGCLLSLDTLLTRCLNAYLQTAEST